MIFDESRSTIAVGDIVIAYQSPENLERVSIAEHNVHHNRLGRFQHAELVGRSFGSKWKSEDGLKYMYALRPTPELWTRVLPHRTQILYAADIALITALLGVRPGAVVVESGTGSGSFAHSLARTIGAEGRLHTFDFHQTRVEQARDEFCRHGLDDRITIACRDVCKEGFGLVGVADCVFLDLPAPWEAVPHAKTALRTDKAARICCFSPCVEQVQKTCEVLREQGFAEIEMYECLAREHVVSKVQAGTLLSRKRNAPVAEDEPCTLVSRPVTEMRGHTSFLTFATLLGTGAAVINR